MTRGARLNIEKAFRASSTRAPDSCCTRSSTLRLRSTATSSTTKQGDGTLRGSKPAKVSALGTWDMGSSAGSGEVEARFHDHLPGQSVVVQIRHEGIGVHLFHVPHTGLHPLAFQHHLGADHGRYARGIGNGLGQHLAVAVLMVLDVEHHSTARLAVLDALHMAADPGLALGARTQRGWVG